MAIEHEADVGAGAGHEQGHEATGQYQPLRPWRSSCPSRRSRSWPRAGPSRRYGTACSKPAPSPTRKRIVAAPVVERRARRVTKTVAVAACPRADRAAGCRAR